MAAFSFVPGMFIPRGGSEGPEMSLKIGDNETYVTYCLHAPHEQFGYVPHVK